MLFFRLIVNDEENLFVSFTETDLPPSTFTPPANVPCKLEP